MSQERVDNLFASESWTAVYTAFTNVSLKAYDFDTIREALLQYVADTYPDKFNDMIASSEFIAIVDLVAYLGHSLAFRTDMNTRENFMDTAERRESVLRMAKTLGYNKTRPINATGFMKVTAVRTTQDVYDSEGNSLANTTLVWNDPNQIDWYDNFSTVINAALGRDNKLNNPAGSMVSNNVENFLYIINENPLAKSIVYKFNADISGSNRKFEAVAARLTDNSVIENDPKSSNKFTLVQRNDNLGPGSDRTGFFVYAKAGTLQFTDFNYDVQLSNRVENINSANVSNSDVWVYRTNNNGVFAKNVSIVDNSSRETAIFNRMRTGSGDHVAVYTLDDNKIQLQYPDSIFGNAPYGNYRVWYRTVDNQNFRVNSGDIKGVNISIPYVGDDGESYRLVLTLQSTVDFSENFAGETYASVRRVSPRAYYSQDRMVNAQDYNIYPLTLGSGVVSKVKSINTSFSGNSRYFEMDDPTGHHSNVSVIAKDGTVFEEDDNLTVNLRYNKGGNSSDFIRTKITNVIKHPSLINLFYKAYKDNDAVFQTLNPVEPEYSWNSSDGGSSIYGSISANVWIDGELDDGAPFQPSTDKSFEGSYIEILDQWYRVISHKDTDVILDRPAPDSEPMTRIFWAYRTKFEQDEINRINDMMDKDFYLEYSPLGTAPNGGNGNWSIIDPTVDDLPTLPINLKFTYSSGIRSNENEYKVSFVGKKIVFESTNDVKFFYSNKDLVVNNETSLANRDKITLNYFSGDVNPNQTGANISTPGSVTIGNTVVSNYAETPEGGATFDADFSCTGAVKTYEFLDIPNIQALDITYKLVSPAPDCIEYDLPVESIVAPAAPNNIIGQSPSYTLSIAVADLSQYISSTEKVSDPDPSAEETLEYIVSNNSINIITEGGNISGNLETTYSVISSQGFADLGLKGSPSLQYFDNARDSGNFFFIDQSELPVGETTATADYNTDPGVHETFIVAEEIADTFNFTFGDDQFGWKISNLDNDIVFKQKAYGEINFSTDTVFENVLIKYQGGNFIDSKHWEMKEINPGVYKIVFWTINPGLGTIIEVYNGVTGGIETLANFSVKVEASFNISGTNKITTQTYKTKETFVYDKYLNVNGYVDNSKVKVTTFTTDNDPIGMIKVYDNNDFQSYIVQESYITDNNVSLFRVSKNATAGNDPRDKNVYYQVSTNQWFLRINGIFDLDYPLVVDPATTYPDKNYTYTYEVINNNSRHVKINGIEYKALPGKGYINDPYMSFRWDHYADLDKRIDPSTSNIVDVYVLTTDYVNNVVSWIRNGFTDSRPKPPNSYELRKLMSSIDEKASISDHVSYIPAKFKYLFGEYSYDENKAVFKVIKRVGTQYTNSEIKTAVASRINQYFRLENWDFGDTFYFSELAAYLHKELGDYIASVVITPKYSSAGFTDLLSIGCEPNEIFLSIATSEDVKIINQITQQEITGTN